MKFINEVKEKIITIDDFVYGNFYCRIDKNRYLYTKIFDYNNMHDYILVFDNDDNTSYICHKISNELQFIEVPYECVLRRKNEY